MGRGEPVNGTGDGIIIDDILECRQMIGKTAEESGIPESVISEKCRWKNIFGSSINSMGGNTDEDNGN